MKIYPNPARSTAHISIPSELKEGGKLIVRKIGGEIIEKRNFSVSNSQILSLDLKKHPIGMYKVSLSNENAEFSTDLLHLLSSN
jgi:hypothetical protein